MDVRQIDSEYSVTGQISVEDLEAVRQMGFKSVVCHRPDGEQPGQPEFETIREAGAALGLELRHIPVGGMGLTAENVHAMVDALDELPRPMLGFCRSGARSTRIYQQTQHIRS